MQKIILVIGLLAVVTLGAYAFVTEKPPFDTPYNNDNLNIEDGKVIKDSDELCRQNGGAYDSEHRECLGVTSETCSKINGSFDECASACRNNPNAEVCTMNCVQVCYL